MFHINYIIYQYPDISLYMLPWRTNPKPQKRGREREKRKSSSDCPQQKKKSSLDIDFFSKFGIDTDKPISFEDWEIAEKLL